MRGRAHIDVAALPTTAFGARSAIWWGVCGLVVIEGTMFALLLVSHVYLRGNVSSWPPSATSSRAILFASLEAAVLAVSIWPSLRMRQAAKAQSVPGMRRALVTATVLGALAVVLRILELRTLGFRWDENAYASVVWTGLGLHMVHLVTGTGENALFAVLLFRGPVEEKLCVDVDLNALYWFFVVASWFVLFLAFFLDPRILAVRAP
jgi:cytochrome c oxidase subunit III